MIVADSTLSRHDRNQPSEKTTKTTEETGIVVQKGPQNGREGYSLEESSSSQSLNEQRKFCSYKSLREHMTDSDDLWNSYQVEGEKDLYVPVVLTTKTTSTSTRCPEKIVQTLEELSVQRKRVTEGQKRNECVDTERWQSHQKAGESSKRRESKKKEFEEKRVRTEGMSKKREFEEGGEEGEIREGIQSTQSQSHPSYKYLL